ncbi:hypothetical protein IWZ03DRAFT_108205 [Phyllosticta citriasiana]|uniref:Uncharacterized protein n=1 Tax=Phyllosticta citriasiana TaxID=595635 RepID=A0ABR1KXT2_9PEZI
MYLPTNLPTYLPTLLPTLLLTLSVPKTRPLLHHRRPPSVRHSRLSPVSVCLPLTPKTLPPSLGLSLLHLSCPLLLSNPRHYRPQDPRPSTFRHRPPSAVAVVWTAALHSSPSSSPLGSRIPHQLPTEPSCTTTTTTTTAAAAAAA